MTEQEITTPVQDEAYRDEYRRLWDATVGALTAAVRLNHPQHGAVDFSGFLASALGAVAGNIGSADRLTAGRPGSWESDLLGQLVGGTVGYDATPEELARHRTVPVVVRLNVAQLVNEARQDAPANERAGMLPDLDDALEELYQRDAEWETAHPAPAEDADYDAKVAHEEASDAWNRQALAAEQELRRRYSDAFEAYAARFAGAVLDEAQTIEGLTVPVEVAAEARPDAPWWDAGEGATINPQEWEENGDDLAWRLWAAARRRVGLPTLGDAVTEDGEQER